MNTGDGWTGDDVGAVTGRLPDLALVRDEPPWPWELAFDASPTGLALTCPDGRLLRVNPALGRMLGRPPGELVGRRWSDLVDADDRSDATRGQWVRGRGPGGESRCLVVTVQHLPGAEPVTDLLHVVDDTDHQRATAELRSQLAGRSPADARCGLGTREALSEACARLERSGRPAALAVFDVDGFKLINDSWGHSVGDAVIAEVGRRLRDAAGPEAVVVRPGGDEFAVLFPGVTEGVTRRAQRLLDAMCRPLSVDGRRITVTASGGVAVAAPGQPVSTLLRDADLAMYAAKAAGRNTVAEFHPGLLTDSVERLELQYHLSGALDRHELRLVYQPIVEVGTGRLRGVEALLRWHHPDRGIVAPDRFIPVAEDTGLIVPIGAWVVDEACREAAALRAETGVAVPVSVNVSVRQLSSPDVVEVVRAAVARHGLPPDALTLEVTESLLMDGDEAVLRRLVDLHDLGVNLAIDDFGAGHSSLTRLRALPVSTLKIDRQFVAGLSTGAANAPIVAAVVALAQALGLSLVAEGVETDDQREALAELGCACAQGYLWSRPVPPVELPAVVRQGTLEGSAPPPVTTGDQRMLRDLLADLVDAPRLAPALRPVLAELARITGLEAVYLTRLAGDEQVVEIAHNTATPPLIAEGLRVPWEESLCARVLAGGPAVVTDVPAAYPDSAAAAALGLRAYLTAPVADRTGALTGTLCGASRVSPPGFPAAQQLFRVVARLIGDASVS